MNKAKLYEKEKALKKNPEYIKDWERFYTVPDKHLLHEIQKKYGIKKLPNPNYDPQLRVHRKIKPTPNPRKHIPLENFYRPRAEGGVREDDPPEVKRDYAEYRRYRKEREKWEIPISPKKQYRLGELADKGATAQIEDELVKIIKSWAKKHPEIFLTFQGICPPFLKTMSCLQN